MFKPKIQLKNPPKTNIIPEQKTEDYRDFKNNLYRMCLIVFFKNNINQEQKEYLMDMINKFVNAMLRKI